MYYKAFVLLRLPVSVLCLCGFGLLNMWQELGMGFFGFVVVVGLLVFLSVTTRRLVRRRRGAFRLAWRLLLLEFAGAVLFVGSHDMAARWNMGYVFAWVCTVLVVWTAPNALLLYRWRWKFLNAGKKSRAANSAFEDLGAPQVISFLAHLERQRHNGATTRNVRLSAIHSFFHYVAARHPDRLEHCQRVIAIPFKRAQQRTIEYLEYEEIQQVLMVVDRSTCDGRRDYLMLAILFNTGARVQEALNLRACDLQLTKPYQVRLLGKGRKERFCPLWPQTARLLRDFCKEKRLDLQSHDLVFLNHRGDPLTRFGVRYLLRKYLDLAKNQVPGLAKKRLHPHSLRHSTAVALLKAGVDLSTISQWLGHANPTTTNKYATLDLEMKRKALAKVKPLPGQRQVALRKNHTILDWLESL